jgi:DNA-binding MarR family transcriptional regulator
MKHFTMESPETPPTAECRFGGNLAVGPDGLLYDRRFRETLTQKPFGNQSEAEAAEALAALRVAGKAMRQQMARFAERHGLSEGRLFLLFHLGRAPHHQLPLGEIAEHLDVSPRNVTGLIDHLEKDGLVERVHDLNDRRSIQARLTPSGLQTLSDLWDKARESQVSAVRDFSPEELKQLRHLCLRVVEKLAGGRPAATQGRHA